MTPEPDLLDALAEAEDERDRAFLHLDATDRSGQDTAVIMQAIRAEAATGRVFSANDIRSLLPEVNRARIGRCFKSASDAGLIRAVGMVKSSDKGTHAHRILTWQGVA